MADQGDLHRLRLLPVNLFAALKLRRAGLKEDADVQPIFQLMRWGMVSDARGRYRELAEELAVLESAADQETALAYLLRNVAGGVNGLCRDLGRAQPRPAAQILLNQLDMRIKAVPYGGALPETEGGGPGRG